MSSSFKLILVSSLFAVASLPGLALAQSSVSSSGKFEPPPPPAMQAFDPDNEPQVTIRQTQTGTETEFRIRGKLYMLKVVPTLGDPYYLVDQTGEGKFVRSDDVGPSVSPPMWVISTF